MTMPLDIVVRENIARLKYPSGFAVCENSNYTVSFEFDSEWEIEGQKMARFSYNGTHEDVEISGSAAQGYTCSMPIIPNCHAIEIGAYIGTQKASTPVLVPMKPIVDIYRRTRIIM